MTAAQRNTWRRRQQSDKGFVLIALLTILTLGALYFFVSNLTPSMIENLRQQKTDAALMEAREALLGYALKYREAQATKDLDSTGDDDRAMYGYLPLPDMGSTRNQNIDPSCRRDPLDINSPRLEGCDANTFTGITFDTNGMAPTVVGRFPWRILGTGPLRDGYGECLWLIISSSHSRIQRTSPAATPPAMNWDTRGQLEVVIADNQATLHSKLMNKHERPIAVIFAPGAMLGNMGRAKSTAHDVTECGGDYDAQYYLEALNAVLDAGKPGERIATTNYFSGAFNSAAGNTSPDPTNPNPKLRDNAKPLSLAGSVSRKDGNLLRGKCPDCELVANDQGLELTAEQLFSRLRGGLSFRTDISSMLDRMAGCLRDKIAAVPPSFPVVAIPGLANPADKIVGRPLEDPCYNDDQSPLGYFTNYGNTQVFLAKPNNGNFTVNGTGSCGGVLLFAGQRGTKAPTPMDAGESPVQLRDDDAVSATNSVANTDWPANYLEGVNLANLTGLGMNFAGPTTFDRISASQTAAQDIVRCIPTGATLSSDVVSPVLQAYGGQLTSYDANSRTLTLGRVLTSLPPSSAASALFGCTWTPEAPLLGNGLRSYFKFQIINAGEGFTFAIIDGDRNGANVCGGAYQHLGYSGNNGVTPIITHPKIGIEFDTAQITTQRSALDPTRTDTLNNGRSDPNYPGQHFGIVYWGGETLIPTRGTLASCTTSSRIWSSGACYLKAEEDDNVHGRPIPPDPATRPSPRNPVAPLTPTLGAGIYKLDPGNSQIPVGDVFHVRTEIERTATNSAARSKSYSIKVWLLKHSDLTDQDKIAAMKNTTRAMSALYPGYPAHVSDNPVIYDIQGGICAPNNPCPGGQTCGSDNMCYTEALRTARIGFTTAQRRTAGGSQSISISDLFTTWLP